MLAGKKTTKYSGEVFLNGTKRDHLYSRVTSYVPHNEIVPAYWTVSEAVEFNHRLRVDAVDMSPECRKLLVEEILNFFGLLSVKNQLIGDERTRGISSGQKRRVTLARGFVGGSQVVFADEPTSGLSATDAELCIRSVAAASRTQGTTFVVVIHQPRMEVAALFDHLTLITSNPGRVVYNGAFADANKYFSDLGCAPPKGGNATDYFMDVITPDVPGSKSETFAKAYLERQAPVVERDVGDMIAAGGKSALEILHDVAAIRGKLFKTHKVRDTPCSVPFQTQVSTLMMRRLTLTARDKSHLRLRVMMSILQGLVIGVAFLDIGNKLPAQQVSFLFMMLQMGAVANMIVMPEMIAQRMVFKFETSDAMYETSAAVLVDSVVQFALTVLGNFVTVVIMYSLSGLSWSMFGTLYFWSFMSLMVMTNYFKVVAAVAPTPSQAFQVAMPGLMLFILFNNFFVSRATVPIFMIWALYVSPMAWAIEQIITGIYPENPTLVELYDYDYSDTHTVAAFFVLLFEMVLFQIFSLVCLRYLNNIKR